MLGITIIYLREMSLGVSRPHASNHGDFIHHPRLTSPWGAFPSVISMEAMSDNL